MWKVMDFERSNKRRVNLFLEDRSLGSVLKIRSLGTSPQMPKTGITAGQSGEEDTYECLPLSRGIKHYNRYIVLQLYKILVTPHLEYTFVIATIQKGCDCLGESAEEIYQDVVWIRTFPLQRENGSAGVSFLGAEEDGKDVEGNNFFLMVSV